ncbi:hypothetical protein [Nocardioides taihuensis]|uniref:Uncharacterized protein n=1 Tax=Nocardioides taihuensis TaxID=1835606 RepID=A0ABW0BF46_9ACTN
MIGSGSVAEWLRFLEARSPEDSVSELRRLVSRLDTACDETTAVLAALSGGPSGDVEDDLRVARSAMHDSIGVLNRVIMRIRLDDPDAA